MPRTRPRTGTGAGTGSDIAIAIDIAELAVRLRTEMGRLKRLVRQNSREPLTPSQISVMATVDKQGPLRHGELARIEAITPPTLTNIVTPLEGRGLLVRRPDPTDGRSSLVELTPDGHEALERIRTERTAFLVQRLAAFTDDELARLDDAIGLIARLAEPEPTSAGAQ